MKRITSMILALAAILAVLSLASCESQNGDGEEDGTKKPAESQTTESGKTTDGNGGEDATEPVFVSGSVTIKMNAPADPIIAALGEPKDTYEAPSCAFQGNDYYYNYGSFEVSAYEENGERRIYSVVLKDDLVTTPEGIAIGSSADDAAKAYGESARTDNGNFVVKTDNAVLTIVIKNGAVSSIDYVAVVGEG